MVIVSQNEKQVAICESFTISFTSIGMYLFDFYRYQLYEEYQSPKGDLFSTGKISGFQCSLMLTFAYRLKMKIKSVSSSIGKDINNIISERQFPDEIKSIADGNAETLGMNDPLPTATSGLKNAADSAINGISTLASSVENDVKDIKDNVDRSFSIGLLGYCKGDSVETQNCTHPQPGYSFNITDALGLKISLAEKLLPKGIIKIEKIYHRATQAMTAMYFIGFVSTPLSLISTAMSIYEHSEKISGVLISVS